MLTNSSDDENVTFSQSLRSFRTALKLENEDTESILSSLNEELGKNPSKYDKKLKSMNKDMSKNNIRLDNKINTINDNLKKDLDYIKFKLQKMRQRCKNRSLI